MAAFAAGAAGLAGLTFFGGAELKDWRDQTWGFAKQILPLLFMGVLAAGFFLGSPGATDAGIVPNVWIQALVGDSPPALLSMLGQPAGAHFQWLATIWPLWTNFFASFTGALMYFATLTEVPILRGLIDSGMGQGPALALLAGRSGALAAEHAGDQLDSRAEEDADLRRSRGGHGDDHGNDFRSDCEMNDDVQHADETKPLEARLLGAIALNALIVVAEITAQRLIGLQHE